MRKSLFTDVIEEIYAVFGKKVPDEPITDGIFERVQNFPDGFMEYAKRRMQDLEKLPANIGRFMVRDLWPDYKSENAAMFTGKTNAGCALCHDPDAPGWRCMYKPASWPDGRRRFDPVLVKCPCAPHKPGETVWTDDFIHGHGFLTEEDWREWRQEHRVIHSSRMKTLKMVGHDGPPRPAHREYLEGMAF